MLKPLTRLLQVPEIPPRAWLSEDSPDFVMGQTLHVVTQGPDEGRAFGLIQPPPDQSAYLPGRAGRRHKNYGRRPPDSRMYVDDFAVFNRGAVSVTEEDGTVSTVAAGRLPLYGGHSQTAIGSVNLGEAVEWLHREGRWTSQADALGLVGVASAVDDPIYGGAVMFRGAALPGMTLREAQAINAQSVSAEVWADPQYDDNLVFAGAVVCNTTAWPYHRIPDALAAETDDEFEEECEGPFCVVFAASTDDEEIDPVADQPTPEMIEVPVGTAADPEAVIEVPLTPHVSLCGGGCGGCKCGNNDTQPAPTVETPDTVSATTPQPADNIAAAEDDAAAAIATEQIASIEAKVADLVKMIEDQGVEIAELTVTVFGSEGMGSANQLDEMTQRINDLQEQVIELLQKIPTGDPDQGSDTAPASITPTGVINNGAIRELQGSSLRT